ncbi:MAG: hypothetical protein IPH03_10540 [Tetrasphaera sp.]|nr:hypothetical protein [Tetrasphaera sp.]
MTTIDGPSAVARPLSLFVVCTGNICRSAFAHHYLAQHLEAAHPSVFRVASGGLGWFLGLSVPRDLIEAAPELAARLESHVPGMVRLEDVRSADLVLTATADHRTAILSEVPAAFKRTFMIDEFARIVRSRRLRPGLGADAWRSAIAEAARHRGFVEARDVPDPYRRGRAAYDDMLDRLVPALRTIVEAAGREDDEVPVESPG